MCWGGGALLPQGIAGGCRPTSASVPGLSPLHHSHVLPQAGRHGAARGGGGRRRQWAGGHQVLPGRRAGAHLLRAERGRRGALALHGEWLWVPGFRAGWGNLHPLALL